MCILDSFEVTIVVENVWFSWDLGPDTSYVRLSLAAIKVYFKMLFLWRRKMKFKRAQVLSALCWCKLVSCCCNLCVVKHCYCGKES